MIKPTKESAELTQKIADAINNETFHLQYNILYDIAKSYSDSKLLTYLEIGCYAGGSACLMLQRPNTNVISIDLGGPIPKDRVYENVNKLNVHSNLYTYIQGNSQSIETENQLRHILQNNNVDILFIDGDHSAIGTQKDFEIYSKYVADGGYIVFDDYNDHKYCPEVKPAVDALDFTNYEILGEFGNEFIVRKKKSAMAIFTLLYNEYKVIDKSFSQLRKTNTLNLPIYAVDNDYPFLTPEMVKKLQKKYNITIIGSRYNRGLTGGYNELIKEVKVDYAILYDCDSYPVTPGWDKALTTVIKNHNVSYLSLMFDIAKREMTERGFTPWQCGDYVVWRPHTAGVQSISCADLSYLRLIGGLHEPKKYYGGLEGYMFNYWNDQHQIGYIDGYFETQIHGNSDINPLYTEYKWQYAHKGYEGSFDDYLKTKQ